VLGPSCRNQIQRPSLARASIDAVKACGRNRAVFLFTR
jgi:hypothetical protein